MTDISELVQMIKAAVEKATPLCLDTSQEVRNDDDYIECPACCGEGHVDAETDYCNIDGVPLGVQFYGIGEYHGAAEEYFRIVTPANILALTTELEKARERIAELEARTVKLPATVAATQYLFPVAVYEAGSLHSALAEAGIKWESE